MSAGTTSQSAKAELTFPGFTPNSFWQQATVRFCQKGQCDVNLSYCTTGDPSDPCVLLVSGLAGQGMVWHEDLVKGLVKNNYYVVRFDNRDVGESTKFDHMKCGAPWKLLLPFLSHTPCPYALRDMAEDGVALLRYLGISSAHWMGTSMGGMICQVAAIEFPKAVKSVISVASSSMNPSLPEPSLRVKLCLISSPKSNSEEDLIAAKVADYKILFEGSPAPEEYLLTFATAQIKRTRYRAGNIRQLYAVRTAKPRDAELEKVKAPFLVLHGAGDVLIPPSHAYHLASIIPNAHLALIQNMGHVMWPGVIPTILREAVDHLKRVEEPHSP